MSGAQLVYDRLPADVTRVSAYVWRPGTAPVPLAISSTHENRQFVVTLPASQSAIVLMQRKDDAYLVDGPMVIRDAMVQREIDPTWRHTIEGAADQPTGAPPLDWLAAGGLAGGGWPACWWRDGSRWVCMGVPLDAAGVIVGLAGAGVLSAVASGDSTPVLRGSAWGRLVTVADRGAGPPPRVRLTAARPVSPSQRSRALRLDTASVPDLRVSAVSAGVYWLAGDSSPPDAWLEIRTARSGPEYVPLADVAQGSPQLPLQVILDDRRDLVFSIVSNRGDLAVGALVTVFRLLDSPPAAGARDQRPPRRVLAGEAIADGAGVAQIDGLGDADYEAVAWHPQLGRASVRVAPGESQLTIRLQSPGVARGRVVVGGKPAGGVDVISVPDATAYLGAADPIDLKGGDARTGADGRFWVVLAPSGGGELRVGGGTYPIVRVSLPRPAPPIVDLGDLELGRPLAIQITLDQDPGCDLRATGPVGRSGLQIVAATRTGSGLFTLTLPEEGSWEVVLLCGRNERALAPAVVNVSARDGPRDVRLTVR
jgi:hypothetical protein